MRRVGLAAPLLLGCMHPWVPPRVQTVHAGDRRVIFGPSGKAGLTRRLSPERSRIVGARDAARVGEAIAEVVSACG